MIKKLFTLLVLSFGIIVITSCVDTSQDNISDIYKYLGTWNVSDQSARINYSVSIIANPSNSSEIIMNNFADLNTTAIALVVGNSLAIDSQSLGSGISVSGSGSFVASGELQFSFDLDDGIDVDSRIATFTK